MTVQCCKCKRVRIGEHWVAAAAHSLDDASHAYCPVCLHIALIEIFTFQASQVRHNEAQVLSVLLQQHQALA